MSSAKRPARKPVIVVAEDDPAVRKMLTHMLAEVGELIVAKDGMEALSAIRALPRLPDLVVTDMMMPRMGGIGLLKHLRSDATGKTVPIIILTAKGGAMDVVTGINAGARHYITKPFRKDDLLEKVRSTLHIR